MIAEDKATYDEGYRDGQEDTHAEYKADLQRLQDYIKWLEDRIRLAEIALED